MHWGDWAININLNASAWAIFRPAVRYMKTIVTNRGLLKPIRSRQEAQFGWKMRVPRLCGSRRFLAVKRHRYRLPQLTDSSDGETWSCSVVHQQFVYSWGSRALDIIETATFLLVRSMSITICVMLMVTFVSFLWLEKGRSEDEWNFCSAREAKRRCGGKRTNVNLFGQMYILVIFKTTFKCDTPHSTCKTWTW